MDKKPKTWEETREFLLDGLSSDKKDIVVRILDNQAQMLFWNTTTLGPRRPTPQQIQALRPDIVKNTKSPNCSITKP